MHGTMNIKFNASRVAKSENVYCTEPYLKSLQ